MAGSNLGGWLFAAAAPSILDSLIRTVLIAQSMKPANEPETEEVDRWTVLVPAREEGENLRPTLQSLRAAIAGRSNVRVLVILDGPDPIGESVARELGAEVLQKNPAGPTKAAALAWASSQLVDGEITGEHALDAVLILDVGSRVEERFFQEFRWKRGSHAMQSMISGAGIGAGDAAAVSERVAQGGEDAGRERMGWAVRLRGTGTAFRPEVLARVAPQLRTQVEDLEASLLLASAGRKLTMSGARIFDEKPEEVSQAATQRARWFVGKLQVLSSHPDAIVRLTRRNPAEGVAFVCEVLGRPLALSALLRCAAAGVLLAEGREGWRIALATAAAGSVALDVVAHARQGASLGSGLKILGAWAGALALAPRSLARWTKARKK